MKCSVIIIMQCDNRLVVKKLSPEPCSPSALLYLLRKHLYRKELFSIKLIKIIGTNHRNKAILAVNGSIPGIVFCEEIP